MGISRNRPLPIAPPRPIGWRALLASLLPGRAEGTGADPVHSLLDELAVLKGRTGAPPAIDALKRGAAATLRPADWQALGAWAQGLSAGERAGLARELTAAGVTLDAGADGRYVSFASGDLRVTVEPATARVRRSQGGTVLCYEQGVLARAMKISGNQVQVSTAAGTEVWQGGTGQGLAEGLPIVPRYAEVDPTEPPRRPWSVPQPDDLVEPAWSDDGGMADYAPAYDEAVAETGGRILERSDPEARPADLYNCHSFSLTGGTGDLFDPYMRESHPHWLNNPMYTLTHGDFARVRDDQRVHPGDVVVYRKDGNVTHTGVVREVDADGNPTVIESKFGILGRYLHEPFDVPGQYGQPSEFYRPEPA